jgi:hypothetical protein
MLVNTWINIYISLSTSRLCKNPSTALLVIVVEAHITVTIDHMHIDCITVVVVATFILLIKQSLVQGIVKNFVSWCCQ